MDGTCHRRCHLTLRLLAAEALQGCTRSFLSQTQRGVPGICTAGHLHSTGFWTSRQQQQLSSSLARLGDGNMLCVIIILGICSVRFYNFDSRNPRGKAVTPAGCFLLSKADRRLCIRYFQFIGQALRRPQQLPATHPCESSDITAESTSGGSCASKSLVSQKCFKIYFSFEVPGCKSPWLFIAGSSLRSAPSVLQAFQMPGQESTTAPFQTHHLWCAFLYHFWQYGIHSSSSFDSINSLCNEALLKAHCSHDLS